MTYLQFHLLFLVPPLLLLLPVGVRAARRLGPRARWALPAVAILAVLYTLAWDAHLIARGVWWYGADRVLGTVWGVPWEEVAFFVLQPFLTGLWLYWLLGRQATRQPGIPGPASGAADASHDASVDPALRWVPAFAWFFLALVGVLLLGIEAGVYLGLILVWAAPVLGAQWAFAAGVIRRRSGTALLGIAVPTVYLWAADRAAIGMGIWSISPSHTLGVSPLGLPLEEAVFFLLTNVLVVQGVLLFLFPRGLAAVPVAAEAGT